MGAKKTPDLIPMCHPILLTSVDISFKEESQPDREGHCSIIDYRNSEDDRADRSGNGSDDGSLGDGTHDLRYVQSHRSRDERQ